ncbi:armadillo-type protein [Mycena leptocephala]|nr:armadillo-type protein [Mycena leptocephala]
MHPLTRQQTLDSVLSWWSDSNPVGPNINLHAAAKPLMRFLYHRDALAFIRKHSRTALTKESMEIYSSYLAYGVLLFPSCPSADRACSYKYVSSSTKSAILMDLQTRVTSEDDARAVADFLVLYLIGELVGSPDAEVRRLMCGVLEELAHHRTTARVVVGQLVSLLRGENLAVSEIAATILYRIATLPESMQATVDTNVLKSVAKLFPSPNEEVRTWTLDDMLGELARHGTTARAVVRQLVSLLRRVGENLAVIELAAETLYRITISHKGMQAAADLNVVESVAKLLSSPNKEVRKWTHGILGRLASYETTAAREAVAQLVSLLHDGALTVIESVLQTLYQITQSPQGAQAAVDANVLKCVAELLLSPNEEVRRWIGRNLAVMESAAQTLYRITISPEGAQAAVDANLLDCVVKLLESPNGRSGNGLVAYWDGWRAMKPQRDGALTVIESVLQTLYQIAQSPQGAQAAVDANVLKCVAELLLSPNEEVRRWTCGMLGKLARHENTMPAILSVNPCQPLVSLLRQVQIIGRNLAVMESAAQTLYRITRSPEGAQAAVDANLLDCVAKLLESPSEEIRKWTHVMLGQLARHETTTRAVVRYLVSLLRRVSIKFSDENVAVIEIAAEILYRIATSPEGAQAAVDGNLLDYVVNLLGSPKSLVLRWTCRMLERLASYGPTTAVLLNSKPCVQLVSLLRNTDLHVRSRALFVLCKLSEPPSGVAAIAATDVLAHVSHLMESTDSEVQLQTCLILRNLARYKPGRLVVSQEL